MTGTTSTQRVFISGKVRGVGFRDWVVRHAQGARPDRAGSATVTDGRVEILVIGDSDASNGPDRQDAVRPLRSRASSISRPMPTTSAHPRGSPSGLPSRIGQKYRDLVRTKPASWSPSAPASAVVTSLLIAREGGIRLPCVDIVRRLDLGQLQPLQRALEQIDAERLGAGRLSST